MRWGWEGSKGSDRFSVTDGGRHAPDFLLHCSTGIGVGYLRSTMSARFDRFGARPFWLLLCVAVLCQAMTAQTFSVVHSFGGVSDGARPEGAVTFDKLGNLYGTTYGSTDKSFGSVYKIDSS